MPTSNRGRTWLDGLASWTVLVVPIEEVAVSNPDPTFYRSPGDAAAAPPEQLAYVAAFDPKGAVSDAMTVVDVDSTSASYGRIVGWTDLSGRGDELHHFGWNACSSALCHGHHGHAAGLEWRYLVVPGLQSSVARSVRSAMRTWRGS